jgi:hypothetical protein
MPQPSLQTLAALDNAATRFDDNPTPTNAAAYRAIAELYARLALINSAELGNILAVIVNHIGA